MKIATTKVAASVASGSEYAFGKLQWGKLGLMHFDGERLLLRN
jgi:hypothetical protein